MRPRRKTIAFYTRDGRTSGKVEVVESGSRGNRHYNPRRPHGPVCECGAPWESVCPTMTCPGSRIPRRVIRSEKVDAETKRYGERAVAALEAKHGGRRHEQRPLRRAA